MIDGVLRTPPADGRLRRASTRMPCCAGQHRGLGISVTPQQARLQAASEVFVTNAVHGVRPSGRWLRPRGLACGPGSRADGSVPRQAAAQPPPHPHRKPCGPPRPAWQPGRRQNRGGPVTVLIDNYDSFTYNLEHMLTASGCRVEVVRNDEVSAQQVASFRPAGVVISPGPCTPATPGSAWTWCGPAAATRRCWASASGTRPSRPHSGPGSFPRPAPCTARRQRSPTRPRLPGRPAAAIRGDPLPLADGGRGHAACLPAGHRHGQRADPMASRHSAQSTEGVQFHPESISPPAARRSSATSPGPSGTKRASVSESSALTGRGAQNVAQESSPGARQSCRSRPKGSSL